MQIMFDDDADLFEDSEAPGSPGSPTASDSETEPELPSPPDAQEADETTSLQTADKVRPVLHALETVGMDLPSFLDALSWGNPDCIKDPTIRISRTKLMKSNKLLRILRHWWKPPVQGGAQLSIKGIVEKA